MSSQDIDTIATGAWSQDEDQRLREAVAKHDTRWILVAAEVGTRNGEQCAKRWNSYVNPDLDHSSWSAQEDQRLLPIVALYGHNWKHIAHNFFPARAPLSIKNRYSLLMRQQRRKATRHQQQAIVGNVTLPLNMPPSNEHPPCTLDLGALHSSSFTNSSDTPFFPTGLDSTSSNYTVNNPDLLTPNTVPSGLMQASDGGERNEQNAAHGAWQDTHIICEDLSSSAWGDSGLNRPVKDGHQLGPVANGSDIGLEFSVTCSRARLRAMVCHIFEGALSETAGLSEEDSVTVTLQLK